VKGADVIRITTAEGRLHYLALSYDPRPDASHKVRADGRDFAWRGYYGLFDGNGVKR